MHWIIRIKIFFISLYHKLASINDSPQRIALGFSLGVFLGILPGVGPLASLVLATLFHVNRLAALAGSFITNTWLSIVTFILAIKIGSAILGTKWQEVIHQSKNILKNFQWQDLSNKQTMDILKSMVLGYIIVALSLALIAYLMALVILMKRGKESSV